MPIPMTDSSEQKKMIDFLFGWLKKELAIFQLDFR